MRLILIVALTAAFAVPSSALATDFYKGPIAPGNQAEVIELTVKFDGNRPEKLAKVRWANVPTECTPSGSSAVSGVLDGKVRVKKGQFEATKPVRNTNATVHIAGEFKDGDEKVVGTFRQTGSSGACVNGDTGELDFHAKRTQPE
jgi:hypothetical protein